MTTTTTSTSISSWHPILTELRLNEKHPHALYAKEDTEESEATSVSDVQALDILQDLLTSQQVPASLIRDTYNALRNRNRNKYWRRKHAASQEDDPLSSSATNPEATASSKMENDSSLVSQPQDKNKVKKCSTDLLHSSSPDDPEESSTPAELSLHTHNHSQYIHPHSQHFRRHIALRIYYNGEHYNGLSENIGRDNDQSVEKALFGALVKIRLIESRSSCHYSRCGRTDKGVSASGQVLALWVKSAFRTDMKIPFLETAGEKGIGNDEDEIYDVDRPNTRPIQSEDLPKNSFDSLLVIAPPRKSARSKSASQRRSVKEYSYDTVLNNLLPADIRVLGWCVVSDDFSARFSALSRTYRYFFRNRRENVNVKQMQSALDLLVGTHDFRNFCRMDVEKVYNFERTIYSAKVIESTPDYPDVGYIEIHGQAFLWHQIRCIAAIVLSLVGQGLESPSVVRELLNVQAYPGKPSYAPASERPLVLHSCNYEKLRLTYSVHNLWTVTIQQEQLRDDAILAAARLYNTIHALHEAPVLVADVVAFAKNKQRAAAAAAGKKNMYTNVSRSSHNDDDDDGAHIDAPFGTRHSISWREALEWMKDTFKMSPEPNATGSQESGVYVPLLQRPKGPSYHEKVSNLQKNMKRQQRYEENVIKKRKTKEEDAAFYQHMLQQGNSYV